MSFLFLHFLFFIMKSKTYQQNKYVDYQHALSHSSFLMEMQNK